MRARVSFLAFLLLLAFAAPAHAGWQVTRAEAIANAVWHDPCGGKPVLKWADLRTLGVHDAWAAADVRDCEIVYDTRSPTSWPRFCTVTLHEFGHLAGYRDPANTDDPEHSDDPFSVMYADQRPDMATDGYAITAMRNGHRVEVPAYDPRCRDRGRPFLRSLSAS